jgi:hypothetical protein
VVDPEQRVKAAKLQRPAKGQHGKMQQV